MRAIFGGKTSEELNKLLSPQKQNKILFALILFLIAFGIVYVLSFYF